MKKRIKHALLSLLIAFGIWIYVVSVVAPESERVFYDIPVKLHGEEVLKNRRLMLVSGQNEMVDLTLSGTRTELNNLSGANIAVYADLSGITSAGQHTVHYTISNLGAITVVAPETQTITVTVVDYEEKELPIEIDYVGQMPAGFEEDRETLALGRKVVTISGAKEEVDRVKKASITVNLDGQKGDIDGVFPISFLDEDGKPVELVHAKADVEKVTMVMKVNMVKTVPVVVTVIPGGDLTVEDAECVPYLSELEVVGPVSVLENFNYIELVVEIGEMLTSKVVQVDLKLPDDVESKAGISYISVDVKIPAMVQNTWNILVTPDAFDNVPEGMVVKIGTSMLAVTVIGRDFRMNAISEKNVNIRVDLTDAKEGQNSYSAQVTLQDAEGVEVVGTYWVTVTLEQETPEVSPEE